MERIKAELTHFTPEHVILNAMTKPYKLMESNIETSVKVINTFKHGSCAEHIVLNFNIAGISRLNLFELERHRMAEFEIADMFSSSTVQSTRYTIHKAIARIDDNDFDIWDYFVKPQHDPEKMSILDYEKFIYQLEAYNKCTMRLMAMLKPTTSNDFLKYFLPEGFRCELAYSINLRSFMNFISLRKQPNAHFEIRKLAEIMLSEVNKTYISAFFKNV